MRLKRILLLLTSLYAIVMLGMFVLQRDLMYHPDSAMKSPAHYGLKQAQKLALTAQDGTKLVAWYIAPQPNKPLLLYFHGNRGNLGGRYNKIRHYTAKGMGILALSYRGYGGSEGTPTEEGLYQDARAALDYATKTFHLPASRLIYYGESLGTGVAVQLASEASPSLLVLEAPYTSIVARAQELYPWLWVSPIVHDRYDSLTKIKKIHAPLLIFHNTDDAVIPLAHGKTLYAAANPPKRAIWFHHTGHVDFNWQQLEREIEKSWKKKTTAQRALRP